MITWQHINWTIAVERSGPFHEQPDPDWKIEWKEWTSDEPVEINITIKNVTNFEMKDVFFYTDRHSNKTIVPAKRVIELIEHSYSNPEIGDVGVWAEGSKGGYTNKLDLTDSCRFDKDRIRHAFFNVDMAIVECSYNLWTDFHTNEQVTLHNHDPLLKEAAKRLGASLTETTMEEVE